MVRNNFWKPLKKTGSALNAAMKHFADTHNPYRYGFVSY